MTLLTETYDLAGGTTIPKIGFGTWQIPDGAPAYDATAAALAVGYRHIDTARAYGNEASVGRAIADSGIPREEIYLTTKLPAQVKSYDGALASFETTIGELGMDYVDLYLIHAPWPWEQPGTDHVAGNIEAWRAMTEIKAAGRARSIGVSNFKPGDLEPLIEASGVVPEVDQIRYFIGHTEGDTTRYCAKHGILVEAYSPLATGKILDNPDLQAIANRYGKSVAQVCIRYVLQNGFLPLPKTLSPERMAENADVDFEIDLDDMAYLDDL